MKSLSKPVIALFTFFYVSFAHAAVGQKIAAKFTQYNDELTIAAVAIFVFGLILLGISMAGGNQQAKNWGKGLLIGGVLVFFAPDLADLIAN